MQIGAKFGLETRSGVVVPSNFAAVLLCGGSSLLMCMQQRSRAAELQASGDGGCIFFLFPVSSLKLE